VLLARWVVTHSECALLKQRGVIRLCPRNHAARWAVTHSECVVLKQCGVIRLCPRNHTARWVVTHSECVVLKQCGVVRLCPRNHAARWAVTHSECVVLKQCGVIRLCPRNHTARCVVTHSECVVLKQCCVIRLCPRNHAARWAVTHSECVVLKQCSVIRLCPRNHTARCVVTHSECALLKQCSVNRLCPCSHACLHRTCSAGRQVSACTAHAITNARKRGTAPFRTRSDSPTHTELGDKTAVQESRVPPPEKLNSRNCFTRSAKLFASFHTLTISGVDTDRGAPLNRQSGPHAKTRPLNMDPHYCLLSEERNSARKKPPKLSVFCSFGAP
jgi:hypothetical protein